MKLPNGGRAIVDISKLRDYCLNATHPRGRHKARVFASVLGVRREDADWLRAQLMAAARNTEAVETGRDNYGTRYTVEFSVLRAGRSARIRSAWIVRQGEFRPRLASCYVLLN